jgi:acyl carrier protein
LTVLAMNSRIGGRVSEVGMDALLLDALQRAIVTVCDLAPADVQADAQLADLGIDSLAVAEIIVELEVEFEREFPVHLLRRLDTVVTVGDVARELEAALRDEAGAPES